MPGKQPATSSNNQTPDLTQDLAFLIAQVGSHSQSSFGKLVDPFGLRLAHVGVLKTIFRADGLTQRELGDALGMFPSNLVRLIDELEEKGLVRRGKSAEDRRSYTLQLTRKGQGVALEIDRPNESTSRPNLHVACPGGTQGTDATTPKDRDRASSSAGGAP